MKRSNVEKETDGTKRPRIFGPLEPWESEREEARLSAESHHTWAIVDMVPRETWYKVSEELLLHYRKICSFNEANTCHHLLALGCVSKFWNSWYGDILVKLWEQIHHDTLRISSLAFYKQVNERTPITNFRFIDATSGFLPFLTSLQKLTIDTAADLDFRLLPSLRTISIIRPHLSESTLELERVSNIRKVHTCRSEWDSDKYLTRFVNLVSFTGYKCKALQEMTRLQSLSLFDSAGVFLPILPNLQKLRISSITARDPERFANLTKLDVDYLPCSYPLALPNLETLSVRHGIYGDNLHHLTALTELYLHNSVGYEFRGDSLQNLSRLTSLVVSYKSFNPENIRNLTNLKNLSLSNTYLPSATVFNNLTQLSDLALNACDGFGFTSESLNLLTNLKSLSLVCNCPPLQCLAAAKGPALFSVTSLVQ